VLSLCSRDISRLLVSPAVLWSWNCFRTRLSHLLATYTGLLLSYRHPYLVAFGIGIPTLSVLHSSVSAFLTLGIFGIQHQCPSLALGLLSTTPPQSLPPLALFHYTLPTLGCRMSIRNSWVQQVNTCQIRQVIHTHEFYTYKYFQVRVRVEAQCTLANLQVLDISTSTKLFENVIILASLTW
jgi:hypothetical protein